VHPRVGPYKFLVPVIVPKARSNALIEQAITLTENRGDLRSRVKTRYGDLSTIATVFLLVIGLAVDKDFST
jgi:hypothetical protein